MTGSADPWHTMSGTHSYREDCLRMAMELEFGAPLDPAAESVLRELDDLVGDFLCPRCESPVNPEALAAYYNDPRSPYDPGRRMASGSRVTSCRCIPVCDQCGAHEVMIALEPNYWPLSSKVIAQQLGKWRGAAQVAEGTLAVSGGQAVLLTDDGVGTVALGPSTGGWAEFGHDRT